MSRRPVADHGVSGGRGRQWVGLGVGGGRVEADSVAYLACLGGRVAYLAWGLEVVLVFWLG